MSTIDTNPRQYPDDQTQAHISPYVQNVPDDEGSETSEDEGEMALLGSARRSRRRDSSVRSRIDPDVWEQAKEIVIEVSGIMVADVEESDKLSRYGVDGTYAVAHNCRTIVHRRAVGSRISMCDLRLCRVKT